MKIFQNFEISKIWIFQKKSEFFSFFILRNIFKKCFLPISTQNFSRIPKIVLRKPCGEPKHAKTSRTRTQSNSGKFPENFQKPSVFWKISRNLKVTDPHLERKWSRPPPQEFYMFNNYIRPGSTPIFIAIGREPNVSPRLVGQP